MLRNGGNTQVMYVGRQYHLPDIHYQSCTQAMTSWTCNQYNDEEEEQESW